MISDRENRLSSLEINLVDGVQTCRGQKMERGFCETAGTWNLGGLEPVWAGARFLQNGWNLFGLGGNLFGTAKRLEPVWGFLRNGWNLFGAARGAVATAMVYIPINFENLALETPISGGCVPVRDTVPMLIIRDEQMAILRRSRWESLIEQMTVELPVEHPGSFGGMDLEELESFVREQVTAARGYGFRSFDLVRRYLVVAGWAGSLDAARNSEWAVPVLEDEISSPERRMDELEDWAGRTISQGLSLGDS